MRRIGRYELVRPLGRGGSGEVWEAVRVGPGPIRRRVALKALPLGIGPLEREARLGSLLRHRHLVDVYDVLEQDGVGYCAMELCREGALTDDLPLPPRAVVEVGLAVCSALQYAHEELGLVHLDLKPANLLVDRGVVKVADLGIASAEGFDGLRQRGGTPGYMAPEQLRGEVDARTDIYALGVTLLELATGRPPAAAETLDLGSFDTLEPGAVVEVGPPARAPSWLDGIVERCIRSDPSERFQSMAELAGVLRELDVDGPRLLDHLPPSDDVGPERIAAPGFVGRATELVRLTGALEAGRWLHLKGPAGIGKSRLADELGRRWPHAVARCDVGEVNDASGLLHTLGVALRLGPMQGDLTERAEQVGHALAGRGDVLVILDQVDGVCRELGVLEACRSLAPRARLVLTSRSGLDLEDVAVERLGPLGVDEAVALLVERARERGVEVAGDPNLRVLAQRLDGVPLALELAAGRLGVLSVADVLENLSLSLLRRGTDDRHGTLRAALDWSWEQLSEAEQSALAQLSVFVGRFSVEAAQRVVVVDGDDSLRVVDALVERSMVTAVDGALRLLAGVREYAAEHDPGEAARRHARYYAELGARAGERWTSDTEQLAAFATEIDELVAATRWGVGHRDGDVATACLEGVQVVMERRGPYDECAELARSVLAIEGLEPANRGMALQVLASCHRATGRAEETRKTAREAVAIAIEHGLIGLEGRSRVALGLALWALRRFDASRSEFERALPLLRAVGNRRAEGAVLGNLGGLCTHVDDTDQARVLYRQAIEVNLAAGGEINLGILYSNMAGLLVDLGRVDEGLPWYERALEMHDRMENRRSEAITRANLASTLLQLGRVEQATTQVRRAIRIHAEIGNRRSLGVALGTLGDCLLEQGDLDGAEDALRRAVALHVEHGNRLFEGFARAHLARLYALRVDEAAWIELERSEAVLSESRGDVIRAWAQAVRAEVSARLGDLEGAVAALDRTRGPGLVDQPDLERARARARAVIAEVRGP